MTLLTNKICLFSDSQKYLDLFIRLCYVVSKVSFSPRIGIHTLCSCIHSANVN